MFVLTMGWPGIVNVICKLFGVWFGDGNSRACYVRSFEAVAQVTVVMLCSFFSSRGAGSGRVCYVRSFRVVGLVTVAYAMVVLLQSEEMFLVWEP